MKTQMAAAALTALLAVGMNAQAAEFAPTRPLVIVVPVPPGGTTDILARLLADKLTTTFKQPVVVENRPGGATVIGARQVLNAPADGQTMFLGTFATIANTYLSKSSKVAYTDFDPVSLVINTPNVLNVGPGANYKSVGDLVNAEKAKPGSVSFASTSNGGSPHLSGALFNSMAKTQMVHVPYPGSAPAIADLLGGHIGVMFDNLPAALAQINAGKLRPLAVTTKQRVPALPNVPTLAESGFPDYEVNAWFGMLARKGTPPEAISAWSDGIKAALDSPDVKQKLISLGAIPVGSTPANFAAYLKAEDEKWARVIREANIKLD
ncbi:Bug family tripartite tricarboxylate transporter substrate binding protein [Ottowia thiooxydans]|uniref:Bug family tripartite tricarboxylate transporter substrate binding protein n=1 Tax=Ottowia thiooxydans TaxID=219182 RepID=UPI00048AE134|nr:tripartite tricarboxylate transporter substrate binding protein [Ottowia thiooxydans]